MKKSIWIGLAILISINGFMLMYAKSTADRTCEEGEALVCFDENKVAYHIEENAHVNVEVVNAEYGEALVQLFNDKYPAFSGAVTYTVGSSTDSDIKYVSIIQALFKMNDWYELEDSEHFNTLDKVASEINYSTDLFVPMNGDGFAFITNLDRLTEFEISTEDLNNDGLVDAVDDFTKIQTVFQDQTSSSYIMHLSLNEPYVFYPFLTAGGWKLFEENSAYAPGFEKDSFLESLTFIENISKYKWNGTEALPSSEYDWDYVSAMEKNDFVFSLVASWMFVDSLEAKIEGNWKVSHLPSMDSESSVLSPLLTNVSGYVIKKDVKYPSLAHEVLRLIRSTKGISAFMSNTSLIPLAPLNVLNQTQMEDNTKLEFAKALSYGQTEPLIAFENDPTLSAYSLYYGIDIMPIIQRLWDGEISAYQAQIEICTRSDTWLYQHELKIQNSGLSQ